jgi:hypothetical protein
MYEYVGGLTPKQRWALIDGWGNVAGWGSVDAAIDEALKRSPELRRLWESRDGPDWWFTKGAFWDVWWAQALPVLGLGALVDDGRPHVEGEADVAADEKPSDTHTGVSADHVSRVTVPFALAEEAVQLHVREGHGRRPLEQKLPGLGNWGARAVLYWYRAGEPAGLWLDEHERLCWGPAINPVWGREQDREQHDQADAPTPVSCACHAL